VFETRTLEGPAKDEIRAAVVTAMPPGFWSTNLHSPV
jgi:hypothetical protein